MAGEERRRFERFPCSCLVSCHPVAGGDAEEWWDGMAWNIARGGIALVSDHFFSVGAVVKIRLQLGVMETVLLLTAQVARAQYVVGGKWLLGCRLTPELRPDEVAALRDRPGAPPA